MADLFDIDSGGKDYQNRHKEPDYHRWTSSESNLRKDPRLASRDERRSSLDKKPKQLYDKLGVPISPKKKQYSRSPSPTRGRHKISESSNSPKKFTDRDKWNSSQQPALKHPAQMFSQPPPNQPYQQGPPRQMYNEGYPGYPHSSYQQAYSQNYSTGYGQYGQYQGYGSGHGQPGPPGSEYPGAWAPVPAAYSNVSHPPPSAVRPTSVPAPSQPTVDQKIDDGKKEAAIAQELKTQRATLLKQRDEYLRRTSVLRRELEKLRAQKHEILSERSPSRDSQRVLRENAKLQLEIQNKLKSIINVVDMLSGIIGDGLKTNDEEVKVQREISPAKHSRKDHHSKTELNSDKEEPAQRSGDKDGSEWPRYHYVHYDPESHWCRTCDVFPQSAKDYLNHLHSTEHSQVTQERQLIDTPWHKLPSDEEVPSHKGAPVKRVPIRGLQFFIPATAWYCKLCDTWIGDLHCASIHLKSKNHSYNYSNFIEQNPNWENNWRKDKDKANMRCVKGKLNTDDENVPPAPEPPMINDKKHKKRKDKRDSPLFDSSKDKKKRKKSKKRKKVESSGSSSSSSSADSSSDESDKSKNIRAAMRNKMLQAQRMIEFGDKWEALERFVGEENNRSKEHFEKKPEAPNVEDNIVNQWMTVSNNSNNDKHVLGNMKGRVKIKQEEERDKVLEAAAEQRKQREKQREERELKEMRERELKELEKKKIEREKELKEIKEREEKEKLKEREHNRRKMANAKSPERFRSRSRSAERKKHGQVRSHEKQHKSSESSPPTEKFRPRRVEQPEEEEEPQFEKHRSDSDKHRDKKSSSRKLPFIGRMPLYKKKGDGDDKDIKGEDYEFRPSKFEQGSSARAFIPAPGVVHITKLATPPDPIRVNAENPPPPPKIIPEPPQISGGDAPPPPRINDVNESASNVQDMELEDAGGGLPPPAVPMMQGKPKPPGNHLPRDFQDALNIIFPGDQRPDLMGMQDPAALMAQYQYYGMMYPGMHMYDYNQTQNVSGVNIPPPDDDDELMPEPPPPTLDDKEDLAMLGIDAEDMAAQTF